jgi:hypothetical protein
MRGGFFLKEGATSGRLADVAKWAAVELRHSSRAAHVARS